MFSPWRHIEGKYLDISRFQKYKEAGIYSFHLENGTAPLSQEHWDECLENLKRMEGTWELQLSPNYERKRLGWTRIYRPENCNGPEEFGKGEMHLALFLVEPLLKSNLVESEKLAQQWMVAQVVSDINPFYWNFGWHFSLYMRQWYMFY